MEFYYLFIFVNVFIAHLYSKSNFNYNDRKKLLIIVSFLAVFIFGFRYQVGVDWYNYIEVYKRSVEKPFDLDTYEVGYKAINVLASYFYEPIVFIIFISTLLFFFFTYSGAAKIGINPFAFFSIVAPYHFVMSGMNYTRQAIALSIFIYSLSYLLNKNRLKFFLSLFVASIFHTSALAFLFLCFIDLKKRYLIPVCLCIFPVTIYYMLNTYDMYLYNDMDSSGLYLRSLYLMVPSFFVLININLVSKQPLILKRLCISVLFSFPVVMIISILSSTIADRFSYYFILLDTIVALYLMKDFKFNKRYLSYYGQPVMFICSFVAFIVWCLYSSYVDDYEFKYYISYLIGLHS